MYLVKALFIQSKANESSSNNYMYGTNKAGGSPLTVKLDVSLTCSGVVGPTPVL